MQILFYSLTGVTKQVAEELGSQLNAKVTEIEIDTQYPEGDIDVLKDFVIEQDQNANLPHILNEISISHDDVILIGFPIWLQQPALAIKSLFKTVDLNDKQIIFFCTSGSTTYEEIKPAIQAVATTGTLVGGLKVDPSNVKSNDILELLK